MKGSIYIKAEADPDIQFWLFGTISSPFAAKDDIKLSPFGARWSPATKKWTTREPEMMAMHLARLGWDVTLIYPDGKQRNFSKPDTGDDWVQAIKKALPEHLHEPAYKALLRVVHPDVGGDTRAAQQLNDGFRERRSA